MGTKASTNFLISIQGHIGILNITVGILEKRVTALTTRSDGRRAGRDSTRAGQDTNGDRGAQEVLREDEEAVDEAEGPGRWTRRLGTSRQCLYRSSRLYEGCLRHQARREEVPAELQGERA